MIIPLNRDIYGALDTGIVQRPHLLRSKLWFSGWDELIPETVLMDNIVSVVAANLKSSD